MGFRYSYLDLSDSDIRGGVGYSCTGSINWWWTAYSKLQTNLVFGQIDNAGQGLSTDSAGGRRERRLHDSRHALHDRLLTSAASRAVVDNPFVATP